MIIEDYQRIFIKNCKKIVGYARYQLNDYELSIEKIFVKKSFRRQANASKMLDYLANKKLPLILEVRTTNLVAVNCYLKTGFIKNRVRKNYYADGTDAFEMIKS